MDRTSWENSRRNITAVNKVRANQVFELILIGLWWFQIWTQKFSITTQFYLLLALRFSQRWLWGVLYSGTWSNVVRQKFSAMSRERTAFIFWVEEYTTPRDTTRQAASTASRAWKTCFICKPTKESRERTNRSKEKWSDQCWPKKGTYLQKWRWKNVGEKLHEWWEGSIRGPVE
jgi:hypothetical protein